jgi:hypothetical protein
MSVSSRLVFDPADAASIAASSSVGAFVRSSDGTLIGNVSDALKVSFTNASLAVSATDLDIRNLVFATDKVDVSGSSITMTATDLDIRDLVAATDSVSAWTKDGSGNSITSTASALDVNIKSGDLDDSLSNASIANESRTVGTSAIATTAAAALAGRKWLYLANVSNKSMYFGKASVTTANGFPVFPGDKHEFRIGPAVVTNVIGEAAGLDLRVMELS